MSTIKLVLEPQADGTLHLPLPPDMRHGPYNVTATIEPVPAAQATESLKGFGALRGKIWMAADFDEPLEDFKDYME